MDNSTHGQVTAFNPGVFSFLYASIISSHLVLSIGDESGFLEKVLKRDYYYSLGLASICSFVIGYFIFWVDCVLQKFYDWKENFIKRIFYQAVLGILLPAFITYLVSAIGFYLYGMEIEKSDFFQGKFTLIIVLLILFNLILLITYLYNKLEDPSNQENDKPFIWVHKSGRNIPINYNEIAYIFLKENYNYLRTYSNEDFLLSQPLDLLQGKLPAKDFFRANRQFIVHISACSHYSTIEFGKLSLDTKPPFERPVIISQKRAKDFKKWAGNT